MAKLSADALHALQMALQNEADTSQIYTHMLPQVENRELREMLKNLIAEEYEHEKKIREMILAGGGQLREPEQNPALLDRQALMDIELKNLRMEELISLALENEKISRDFYQMQCDRVTDPAVKAIFKWLKEEEERHIADLEKRLEA